MSKKNAMKNAAITHLFLDISDALPTNGWDHHARKRAANNFQLKFSDMEDRHGLKIVTDYKSTCSKLASLGLHNYEGAIHETS
jgi:hypothetical protein